MAYSLLLNTAYRSFETNTPEEDVAENNAKTTEAIHEPKSEPAMLPTKSCQSLRLKPLFPVRIRIKTNIDAAIRNQGASIKTLEIQIRQMSKVLQEIGFGSLPSSIKVNPRDHVESISTTIEADSCPIRRIGSSQYVVSTGQNPYSEASHINNSIPRKEKDPGSFTLPCFINNVCFDNALVDLGASISVMPLSTYLNLGLGELAHTKLTVELADRTVKYPKGIAETVLVGI
ncbi:retrovirus-related pol polyprotein from transposon TNT 1-94, partial [Tanacetum coccineum]